MHVLQPLKHFWQLVLLGGLVLGATSTHADVRFEQSCLARLPDTHIEVQLDAPSIKYDLTRSVADLTGNKGHGPGWRTLGLTVMDAKMLVDSNATLLRSPDGETCMRPRVKVVVTAYPQTVYVAREFPQGSCAYKEILTHEMRHVKANIEHTRKAVAEFEAELRKAFGNDIYFGRGARLQDEFSQALKSGWLPNLKARLAQASALHAQIDTPQEYARMSYVCSGEVDRVLKSQR